MSSGGRPAEHETAMLLRAISRLRNIMQDRGSLRDFTAALRAVFRAADRLRRAQ